MSLQDEGMFAVVGEVCAGPESNKENRDLGLRVTETVWTRLLQLFVCDSEGRVGFFGTQENVLIDGQYLVARLEIG